jgi:hypothetical protein
MSRRRRGPKKLRQKPTIINLPIFNKMDDIPALRRSLVTILHSNDTIFSVPNREAALLRAKIVTAICSMPYRKSRPVLFFSTEIPAPNLTTIEVGQGLLSKMTRWLEHGKHAT